MNLTSSAGKKAYSSIYLGSDLVSALAGLQVHNFTHFGPMDGDAVDKKMGNLGSRVSEDGS